MQARLIAYPPDSAALTRWIQPAQRLCIGRAPDCDLVLTHPSVSRQHAELVHDGQSVRLRDLDSKNGCFADGMPVGDDLLAPGCWLRFGDVHCEFATFDDAQATALRGRETERRDRSAVMTRQVAGQTQFDSLLDEVLHGTVELAGCSRGFLLLADGDDYAVCASLVIDPQSLDPRTFSGSIGVVQRVLAEGRPVVVNHVASEAWLAGRASIIDSGLQTLVCLPLSDGSRVFGAVYADRRGPGEPVTEFDMELLGAFAETATLWLLARRALKTLDDAPRWSTIVRGQPGTAAAASPP